MASIAGDAVTDAPSSSVKVLSNQVLGITFIVCALLLTGVMLYFVSVVLESLTEPPPALDALVQHFVTKATASQSGDSKTAVYLAVTLEYANADVRAAGVQVAFALVAGMFFAVVGVLLFAAGIVGTLDAAGEVPAAGKWNIKAATPGLVSLLLGAGIISFGVTKDMSRSLSAEILTDLRVAVSGTSSKPPGPGPVEVNDAGDSE